MFRRLYLKYDNRVLYEKLNEKSDVLLYNSWDILIYFDEDEAIKMLNEIEKELKDSRKVNR